MLLPLWEIHAEFQHICSLQAEIQKCFQLLNFCWHYGDKNCSEQPTFLIHWGEGVTAPADPGRELLGKASPAKDRSTAGIYSCRC